MQFFFSETVEIFFFCYYITTMSRISALGWTNGGDGFLILTLRGGGSGGFLREIFLKLDVKYP